MGRKTYKCSTECNLVKKNMGNIKHLTVLFAPEVSFIETAFITEDGHGDQVFLTTSECTVIERKHLNNELHNVKCRQYHISSHQNSSEGFDT